MAGGNVCIPARSWKTIPEEMMGVVPSSINVPLFEASIMRSQYNGSEVSLLTMPYNGICDMTRKMRRVTGVPSVACLMCVGLRNAHIQSTSAYFGKVLSTRAPKPQGAEE